MMLVSRSSLLLLALLVSIASSTPLGSESRSWMPEDAPVLESSESNDPAESSPVPATSASDSVTAAPSTDKSSLTDVLGKSVTEKPEAFLIHFKPKTGQTSKSKYMLLLKLPDGSTETIETNSETLSADASQDAKSVPAVEESRGSLAQQSQFDDDLGFDLEPAQRPYGSSAAAAAGAGGTRLGASAGASAAAGGSAATATASAGGASAAFEQQIQQGADDEQQLEADLPLRPQDTQQKLNDDDLQQVLDDQQAIEQQRDEEGGSNTGADAGYGTQQQQAAPLTGLTSGPNSGAVYTSYAGTADQQVPVILIALPPRASAQSQRQTLNRLLGALKSANPAAPAAVKGLAAPAAARKRPAALSRGKTSLPAAAAPLAPTKGRRPVAQQPLSPAAAVKGGQLSGSLRVLGPLSPVARLAAKAGGGLRVKGTRGRSNTNSPENPQFPQPDGGFGGYGNSHTPSPSGGYGSVAMRLASKGIPPPTERDVQRPGALKAILSLARTPSSGSSAGGTKRGARLSVRTYA